MFHVNPATGEAGLCKAEKGNCPFGSPDDHFTSAIAARMHYETTMAPPPGVTGSRADGEPITYDIPARNLELAENSVAIANRRLEKAGVPERFVLEVEPYYNTKTDDSGFTMAEERIKLTVNTPAVKFEGYQFLAAVEKAEQGFVVKTASGIDLRGYVPDDLRCDSCGKAMNRQKTYLVEDSEGNLIQVGSSCVKNYFGVEPKGLWALTFDPIARAVSSDAWSRTPGPHGSAIPTKSLVAYALAVSNGGEDFVSRGAAYNYGGDSTADQVRSAIFGKDTRDRRELQEEAQAYMDSGEADRVLNLIKAIPADGDYGRNLSVVSSGEWTSYKHMNILIGGLSAMAAEKRAAAKAIADAEYQANWGDPTPGFAGEVKDNLNGKKLRVFSASYYLKDDPYSYSGGEIETTRVVFRDEDNHELIWWASSHVAVDKGDEVTVKSGSIKAHKQYNGVDQTVIFRVRLDTP